MTARYIATIRRTVARRSVPSGDPGGDDRLARSLRAPFPWLPGMVAYIAARTEFFDNQLGGACALGARQVVIVGAGYDGRSIRFRQPGVTFFEVDHPTTQANKLARLDALAIDASDVRFVPLDIGRSALADALAAAGHDRAEPTFFMCEGVTAYLSIADLRHLVGTLAALASRGSSLAVDFTMPKRDRSLPSRLLLGAVRAGTAVMGERMVTLLTAEEAVVLLTELGWSHVEVRSPELHYSPVFAMATTD